MLALRPLLGTGSRIPNNLKLSVFVSSLLKRNLSLTASNITDGLDDVDLESYSSASLNKTMDALDRTYGTGRRKTSVARVWIKEGSGQFIINDKRLCDYFQPMFRLDCLEPFRVSETSGAFDVWCTVKGGGMAGQAGAVRLGVSRALVNYNPLFKPYLHTAGLMMRDSRRVERKKAGRHKARRQYQWVKR